MMQSLFYHLFFSSVKLIHLKVCLQNMFMFYSIKLLLLKDQFKVLIILNYKVENSGLTLTQLAMLTFM